MLVPHVRQWILTRPENIRAVDPNELARLVSGGIVSENVRSAIEYAREHAPEGMTVVVCGSLYLIGEARTVLH